MPRPQRRSPARPDRRAVDGRRGRGSKPTKTSGRPVVSSQPPSPTATSVGGGRMAAIVRTAVEPPAVRRGAERALRPAGCRPATRPAGLDAPSRSPPFGRLPEEQAVAEPRAATRPIAAPIDSPRATAPMRPTRTRIGRIDGLEPGQGIGQVGQGEDGQDAAADRARSARHLRDGPGTPAEDECHDDEQQRDGVDRVHHDDRRTGRRDAPSPTPRSPDGAASPTVTGGATGPQVTVTLIGAAPPVPSVMVYVARRQLAEVHDRLLELGDVDAGHVAWTVALAQGDVERRRPGLRRRSSQARSRARHRWRTPRSR